MADDDKQAITVDQAPSPSVPSGQPAVPVTPMAVIASQDQDQTFKECVSILVNTQNECLAELGYHPTLLKDYQDLQTNNVLLYNDNQKLYADNRSLALFIKQQDQRLNLLQAPVDQQKNTITQLHEFVRKLTQERDDFAGKLHQAYNEIVMLRQELARFVPNALSVSNRVVLTGQPQTQSAQSVHGAQRRVSLPVLRPRTQQMSPANAPMPQALMEYQSLQAPYMVQPSPHQPNPQHHASLPKLVPVTPSMPPYNIAHSRRASGPSPATLPHPGLGQSPISASPLNNFTGLNLAGSPVTPISSRPGTSSGTRQLEHWTTPTSRPPSSRGLHVPPSVPQSSSSSSLAGAIIDLTEDEGVARKRRKYDHPPGVAIPHPPSVASPGVPISPATTMTGRAPIMAQQYTVLPIAPQSQRPPLASTSAPPPQRPQAPIVTPPQSAPVQAPQHQSATSHSAVTGQAPPMYAHISPTTAQVPKQPQQHYAYSQPPAQAYAVQPQYSATGSSALQPAQPTTSPVTQGQSEPPPNATPANVDSPPVKSRAPDAVMDDVEMDSDEEETTVEEDCIEANFDEDDEDAKKLWCRMCRSRFNRGHTTEAPTPFVSAPQEKLIEHCETVHPSGWAILKSKVAEQRSAEKSCS
ncbi:hypothetical protein C8Q80DRAFT_544645 [Daedaleopsis nitida]|nr:hypothetical protein C8Q80DRAFT_544645 [Daedaleopsis nitida]